MSQNQSSRKWYQNAVVYQIYPRSFYDTNNDGVGDINGIRQKLNYIKSLGVNVIWLCPVYSSPMVDNGYDISDYRNIDQSFGTLEDMDNLIKEAGELGMKVLMDLVVNHCSDKHVWFQEAIKDPKSKYANYFLFQETTNGKAPNNLRSHFGDPAWTNIPGTNRWYFHAFAPEQPDLNWENPELREEIYDMVNWWLDKGLGGFRIDAIGNLKKDKQVFEHKHFEADGPDGLTNCDPYILSQPGIEVYLSELNERTFKPHDAMTVAEVDVPPELLPQFVGPNGFFSMAFDFSYTDIDVKCVPQFEDPTFTVDDIRDCIYKSQLDAQAVGWTAPYLENHDQCRSLNKYIPNDEDRGYKSASMLGTLFFCLRGTPFIYQGEELGMTNVVMNDISEYNDVLVQNQVKVGLDIGKTKEWMLRYFNRRSRDNARTPFPWNGEENAGSTGKGVKPWLKVNPNNNVINVEKEEKDENSVLNFYRRLIDLRQNSEIHDELVYGNFVTTEHKGGIIAYRRQYNGRSVLVINNFVNTEQIIDAPKGKLVFQNFGPLNESNGKVTVAPFQSLVFLEN
ncbi:alpha amylase [Tritrichomonas foetus]|uniref:Alpha amylase n=1 Tax=Tritrichomonas foetus TaxID=1144522 RepID=A0A1J4KBF3_9EUKA|nr:alpha amylase [Tritrichomonas foetus]|eukprot:OHT06805.1 alpha amylase [Tritrichomonas foetus]